MTIAASDLSDEVATRTLGEPARGDWSDMALGSLAEAARLGLWQGGADIAVASTIPAGAGLSSSAALAVAVLKAARASGRGEVDDTALALAARRVENDYIGVPCGIMDQMAVAHLQAGQAMALDTGSLGFAIAPLFADHVFAVVHSGVTRSLSDGRYATRREEVEAAARSLDTDALCLVDPDRIEASPVLDETQRRRARHCATEHRRVLAAAQALEAEDAMRFGALMRESHASMRDDFEMSVPAIDALVADAQPLGALGARLTGGGFGGCIVALVEAERLAAWRGELLARHPAARFVASVGGQNSSASSM